MTTSSTDHMTYSFKNDLLQMLEIIVWKPIYPEFHCGHFRQVE